MYFDRYLQLLLIHQLILEHLLGLFTKIISFILKKNSLFSSSACSNNIATPTSVPVPQQPRTNPPTDTAPIAANQDSFISPEKNDNGLQDPMDTGFVGSDVESTLGASSNGVERATERSYTVNWTKKPFFFYLNLIIV